jgi:hypothetical protein
MTEDPIGPRDESEGPTWRDGFLLFNLEQWRAVEGQLRSSFSTDRKEADPRRFVIDDGAGEPWDRRPGHYTSFEFQVMNDRLVDLKQAYRDFKEAKLADAREWHFFLNDEQLLLICGMFINDLKQFKLLNAASGGADNLRRAAYLSRLVAKLRPIQFDRTTTLASPLELNDSKMIFLNEEFAAYIFFLYLDGFRDEWLETKTASQIVAQLQNAFWKGEVDRELLVTLALATQTAFAKKCPT